MSLQELRTQLADFQGSTHRLEGEQKRLTKLLAASRDVGEQHKNEADRLQNIIYEMKAKHETDVAQARKHAAGLARDKSDLQQTIDTMKAEAARASRRLPRFGSPLTPNGPGGSDYLTPGARDEDDVFGNTGGASTNRRKLDNSAVFPADGFGPDFADLSPDPSPARPFLASNHPTNEIEALQQRLAHAQRQINTLKGTLHREKELKLEYRRKLEASSPGVVVETEDADDDAGYEDEITAGASKPKQPRLTPFRSSRGRGIRGRGRGGFTLIQRLGMAANSPSSDYNDDSSDRGTPPPVPRIPIQFHEAEDDDEFEDIEPADDLNELPAPQSPSPSPVEPPSNRTSVDGMDPAFANVLRRTPSDSSSVYNGSPLRRSVVARPARGGTVGRRSRGGNAYHDARPPSLVGPVDVLSAELGIGGSPMKDNEIVEEDETYRREAVETAEFGCQTEPEEVPLPPPPPIQVTPAMTDMAIQVTPEPEPVPVPVPVPVALPPVVVMSDASMQTDEEPIVPRSEVAVQHSHVPTLASASINTDPEIVAPSPVMVQMEIQTSHPMTVDVDTQTPRVTPRPLVLKLDMDTQTPASSRSSVAVAGDHDRRRTITQRDVSTSSFDTSGDTITRPQARAFLAASHEEEDEGDDGDQTETGAETEPDTDEYQDARQSLAMTTPSESQDEFHSIMTLTDNDMSSDDDEESLKASGLSSRVYLASSSVASTSPLSPPVTYESKAVFAELIKEPTVVPKPEVKEISIQTDEWTPPPPPTPAPTALSVPSSPSFGLYRVGSSGQQFQFVAPPTPAGATPSTSTVPTPNIVPIPMPSSTVFRDSAVAFNVRPRTSTSEKRQSIESAISSALEDGPSRSRVPSVANTLTVVDKTKPPTMVLPPPPRLPPPTTSMPPPSFIPERRIPTNSSSSHDMPPPRPSSPPPPELIQRATTPIFGSILSVPSGKGTYNGRQHGSSMPPSQQGLRQPPSTSSFRSAANAASFAQHSILPGTTLSSHSVRERERRELSSTSLVSDMMSPRSSMSSDRNLFMNRSQTVPEHPVTPGRGPAAGTSTDPAIIHAITQTMIGEFLYKYTRRAIGKGYGERRHKRFFWVHPYTKTLYWSSADPGSSNVSESSAKSGKFLLSIFVSVWLTVYCSCPAYIEGVRSVLDPNPMPPGLYQYSVVVSTPQREMKITAPTKERHDIWLNVRMVLFRSLTAVY